jgi:hypothetical protein
MENPKINTKVIHSATKSAWNVVGTDLSKKYKIARFPYTVTGNEILDTIEKSEALLHAQFVSKCFNKANLLIEIIK